jgi:hypothetical protein
LLPDQPPGGSPDPNKPPEDSNRFDDLECTAAGMATVKEALAPELNFILYRQSRIVGGNAGNWIQVSPLIEYAHFDRIEPRPQLDKFASYIEWRLNDPFVKFVVEDSPILTFLDHYPFALYADIAETQPYEFRYQAVYFDTEHRPVRWRQSQWFGGGGE